MSSRTTESRSRARWTKTCRYILKTVGEDNLMVGSDYTHRDPSMELEFRKELQARADKGEIPQAAVQKILYDNPKAFYAL